MLLLRATGMRYLQYPLRWLPILQVCERTLL